MSDEILNSGNIDELEELYAIYLKNPGSLTPDWQSYFSNLFKTSEVNPVILEPNDASIQNLINGYRTYGHLLADINPLEQDSDKEIPNELKLETYGLSDRNLNETYPTFGLLEENKASLSVILSKLQTTYCDKVGVEYMGIENPEIIAFIQQELENHPVALSHSDKQMILHHLNKSELLEVFLHTKYVGQKRFSLEGGETLIPMLEALIEEGAGHGLNEFFIGMSHRGRLNVLSNILNKSYTELFSEFDESYIPESFEGSGDVKYHKGFSGSVKKKGDKLIKISVTSNPSHLESVDSVIEGQVKAVQTFTHDGEDKIIAILVHGDAAISGQGVVYETLQFSKLPGYTTGGTLHIVVNNQIGFTTAPKDARSTRYCTDIAKTFGAPVFHLNGDDPESAVMAALLALKIRQKFHIDVFLDLNCYRKYGHNETDEPFFTQPLEYQIIRNKRPVREIYRDQLIKEGFVEKEIAENLEAEFKEALHDALNAVKIIPKSLKIVEEHENGKWEEIPVNTTVSKHKLLEVATKFCALPESLHPHQKLIQLMKNRLQMIEEDKPIDWGMAEYLAYATLLWEGVNIRLTGQDSSRGTFSHRHGVIIDQQLEKEYFPLKHLKKDQGRFDLINSPLSEFAALGFEYGYSMMTPGNLTLWEAQFGDFANGAQVIIDQYIASAEQKWGQKSSLVLLLPHGYEGQGPEHSSARIERFLSLAGDNNMLIVYPTTPAQFFHLIRRHIVAKMEKPLVVFTPKGLLRLPECVSFVKDLEEEYFHTVLDDPSEVKNPKRLIFCTGRIYYDLIAVKEKNKAEHTVIIRIEQLYPLDCNKIKQLIEKYKEVKEFYYIQEEPSNMGAFEYLKTALTKLLPEEVKIKFIARKRSAAPATGSHLQHKLEYEKIMSIMKE